jgi:hypothetical protein
MLSLSLAIGLCGSLGNRLDSIADPPAAPQNIPRPVALRAGDAIDDSASQIRPRRPATPSSPSPTPSRRRNVLPHEDISSEDDDPPDDTNAAQPRASAPSRPPDRSGSPDAGGAAPDLPPEPIPDPADPGADAIPEIIPEPFPEAVPDATAPQETTAAAHHARYRVARSLHFGFSVASFAIVVSVVTIVSFLVVYFYHRPSSVECQQSEVPLLVVDGR